jgi:hypothetical protein
VISQLSDWKRDLDEFLKQDTEKRGSDADAIAMRKAETKEFLKSVVAPAFSDLKAELEKHGRKVTVHIGEDSANITIQNSDKEELDFSLRVKISPSIALPSTYERFDDRQSGKRMFSEGFMRSGTQDYGIADIIKEEIITYVYNKFKERVKYG